MRQLRAADLFCGAGGTSAGAESSGAAKVVCAVNHWEIAVETHSRNFPHARHINSRLDMVNPGECPKIDLLFASPECTHHSRARGGRPTSDQQRAGAWDLMRWVEFHRPSFIAVENVREFEDWGPVGSNGRPLESKKGAFFHSWVNAIEAAGYRVDWRVLNAADFGAATSRERLFVLARKGNRSPVFPEPTHGRRVGGELPGFGLQKWRAAAEVIDWSIPCPSVFLRSKPLADKTLARIEAGLRRFVGPYAVTLRSTTGPVGTGGTTRDLSAPIGTLTTGGNHALAVPFVAQWDQQSGARGFDAIGNPLGTIVTKANRGVAVPFVMSTLSSGAARSSMEPAPTLTASGGTFVGVPFMTPFFGERTGQSPRTHSIAEGMPTVTGQGAGGLAVPFLADTNHGDARHTNGRTHSVGGPLGTITSSRGKAVVVPFIVSYYGNGEALDVRRPLGTVTTKDRCGLVYATVETCPSIEARSDGERKLLATMAELGVADIGFRMLSNPELSAAMGFRPDYWFAGNKADVTKQIGNAVSPPMAEALTKAMAG